MADSATGPVDDPVVNIVGEKVALGPMRHDLVKRYRHWMNDGETNRGYDVIRPVTDEAVERWYERISTGDRHILFALYERVTMNPIGHTGLLHVDRDHRNAEFDLFIGDASARGKGFGSEATRLVRDYAFNRVGLQSVYLRVLEFNQPGIRAYEKAGFREAGRLRQNWFVDGRFWDLIYMDCLAGDVAND